jgi:glycosyltransferase involved in cell wall biosynthesis
MRLLWVKAGKLLPVDTGGKIRSYNLLKQLATRHELALLSYYGGARDLAYEDEIVRHFPRAVPIHDGSPDGGLAVYLDYARRLVSPAPYAVTKFTSGLVTRLLTDWLADRRADVVVCDFLSASLNFPRQLDSACVLFQHNVESVLWRRQAAHERSLLRRIAFSIEAAKMARYERATVRRFPRVIAVSERDRRAMSVMTEEARISVVPTGVDLAQYRAAAGTTATRPTVMFLGSMDWEANVDAVEYFCRDIWPVVLTKVPDAIFRIVGRAPQPRVLRLASNSVQVTGTVPSVINDLKHAAVFVVPLRIGGGTRLKIFEAMAAGRAVVSTTLGAEGLDVTNGRDVILADAASDFSEAVVGLLQQPAWRAELERAAADTAARHDWPVIAERFEAVLRQAAAEHGRVIPVAAQAAQTV